MRSSHSLRVSSSMPVMAFMLAALIYSAPVSSSAERGVDYEIAFPNAAHHEAEISVTFAGAPAGKPLEVRMSRSSPGRYALHEFAKNVYNVQAFDGRGRLLAVTRPNAYQWNVGGHDGTVRVTYTLFGDLADGTYAAIDNTHAHLNMPATFMWARGMEQAPIRVTFRKPVSGWKIATQLAPTTDPNTFTAPDLQYFMDSPTEISPFTLREWKVESGPKTYTIRLAVHHAGREAEVDQFAEMAKKVVDEEIAVYGEPAPYDYGTYTFIADYLPYADGDGMEHRNSTILTSADSLGEKALANLNTLSHEFFHSWNVERIRPLTLEPFNFEEANMSGELWFAEGFTAYYDDLFVCRAGLSSAETFVSSESGLTGALNSLLNSPGRRFFSAVEMSRQAPFADGAVSADPTNRQNTYISYYRWGAMIALGLDLTLRTRFAGVTLDDYMRAMWKAHGKPERPYTLADLRRVLADLTKDQSFADEFFRRYVEGKEVMDYASLLGEAGLLVRKAHPGRAWHGATLADQGGNLFVAAGTLVGTPMYRAGLDAGDEIRSLDGKAVASAKEAEAIIAARRAGDQLTVEFDQRGQARRATLALEEDPEVEIVTYEKAGRAVTQKMRKLREQWLAARARH